MALSPARLAGAALLVAAYAPLHRLLDPGRAGPAGAATRAAADVAWRSGLYGTLLVVGGAYVTSRLIPGDRLVELARRLTDALARPAAFSVALATGGTAFVLSAWVALVALGGMPTSVDEMAQLLHARVLAAGQWTLPLPGPEAAWSIQNGVGTDRGWASIYPPMHTMALALGLRFGAAWLVGPVMVGVATALSTLSFERLLGRHVGRAAGALLCVTPFWLLLGATHLSHTTAAAALALALWTALRAREGGLGWALACGACVGAAVVARPWIGLASSAALVASAWLGADAERPRPHVPFGRIVAFVAGGAPFAALLFLWNARLFGSPFRLGYSAAFGPAHGLGLHADPWGNRYGIVEALGYTGADLVQLGTYLLESPLPALGVVGLALLVDRMESPGVLAAWAVTAVAANALYWHHGVHLGPRMLYESTPAWIALIVVAARGLALTPTFTRARGTAAWALGLALAGALVLAPGSVRARSEGVAAPETRLPAVLDRSPGVVFVHGSWASRIAARLAAAGMRRDSVETALRRNDLCAVDRYARWRALPSTPAGARVTEAPRLDLEPLPGSPPHLRTRLLSPGNPVRVAPDAVWDAACVREASSDRLGVIELEPLLWQAPPSVGGETVVARDLGPALNASVLAALGVSSARILLPGADGEGELLLDYDDGIELLWRGAAAAYDPTVPALDAEPTPSSTP